MQYLHLRGFACTLGNTMRGAASLRFRFLQYFVKVKDTCGKDPNVERFALPQKFLQADTMALLHVTLF